MYSSRNKVSHPGATKVSSQMKEFDTLNPLSNQQRLNYNNMMELETAGELRNSGQHPTLPSPAVARNHIQPTPALRHRRLSLLRPPPVPPSFAALLNPVDRRALTASQPGRSRRVSSPGSMSRDERDALLGSPHGGPPMLQLPSLHPGERQHDPMRTKVLETNSLLGSERAKADQSRGGMYKVTSL